MKKRCFSCKRPIDKNSNFCKYCGASLKKEVKELPKKCPKCNMVVEKITKFCHNCGFALPRGHEQTTVTFFLSIIFLILFVVVAYSILTAVKVPVEEEVIVESPSNIKIEEATCSWTGSNFEVCEKVSWRGLSTNFAKGHVSDGEPLSASPLQKSSPFTYCQNIGNVEKVVSADAILFGKDGNVVADDAKTAECIKGEITKPTTFVKPRTYNVKKQLSFRAERTYEHGKGEGIVTLKFPKKPVRCNIEGTYEIDDRGYQQQQRYCHKASGQFTGYADQYTQYVIDDADYFAWAGLTKPRINPEPERRDGYIAYMYTCDNQYHQNKRFYTRARITDFSQDMQVKWEFYSEESTNQFVDVIANLDCVYGKKLPVKKQKTEKVEQQINFPEEETEEVTENPTPFEEFEIKKETKRVTLLEKLGMLIRGIFA